VELLTRKIEVRHLPEAWNAKYTEYLGITPPTDTDGVLQDVHWTRGYVGYFPTYAMGNLIGGQMWHKLRSELDGIDEDMRRGEFGRLLGWLQENVYRHARRYTPRELMDRVVGEPMQAGAWLQYAKEKYGSAVAA
jgi:carboxypeptidase Taq